MNILSAENISKSYSEKILFENISLGINEGEKIALIGINGTGKSTLLKVIAGVETTDTGSIIIGNSMKIGYLPQNPSFEDRITVLEQVFKDDSPVMKLIRKYETTLKKYNENSHDKNLEKELILLNQQMDSLEAWSFETEAKNILTRLGIDDFEANVNNLSGGQRKRIAMASSLINHVDLLILDEPTNHIDNDTVDWLEKYLNKRKGSLLMVTHDRYFLERVANRIIELDNGKLYSYQANYSKYLEMKAEREELEQSSERKRQSLLRTELEWIKRGARARSTKQKARIERFEKLKEEQVSSNKDNIEIKVGSSRLGRKTIGLESVNKGYAGINLIKDFSYILLKEDRIGIIGPNGIGKSTLLKIIAGDLQADSGRVDVGETVKIGFFTQENTEMNGNLRVIEYIREESEFINTNDGVLTASQMLERFLFPPSVQWTPVSKLSGGEKRRLYLLRILMGAPNILLLDEPTNDLDIQTLTILESYIDEFPGIVVTVSHDRYFLDRVANRIFSFEGNGVIKQIVGNYSDYSEKKQKQQIDNQNIKQKADINKQNSKIENKKSRPLKFTYKEQKEFDEIDEIIERLESNLGKINKRISESSSDFQLLQELLSDKEFIEKKLNDSIERWAYLNELAEEIEKNKRGDTNE